MIMRRAPARGVIAFYCRRDIRPCGCCCAAARSVCDRRRCYAFAASAAPHRDGRRRLLRPRISRHIQDNLHFEREITQGRVRSLRRVGRHARSRGQAKIFRRAFLAGSYVGFGCLLALSIAGNINGIGAGNPGAMRMTFASLLPVNLLLIVTTGGELFLPAIAEVLRLPNLKGSPSGTSWSRAGLCRSLAMPWDAPSSQCAPGTRACSQAALPISVAHWLSTSAARASVKHSSRQSCATGLSVSPLFWREHPTIW